MFAFLPLVQEKDKRISELQRELQEQQQYHQLVSADKDKEIENLQKEVEQAKSSEGSLELERLTEDASSEAVLTFKNIEIVRIKNAKSKSEHQIEAEYSCDLETLQTNIRSHPFVYGNMIVCAIDEKNKKVYIEARIKVSWKVWTELEGLLNLKPWPLKIKILHFALGRRLTIWQPAFGIFLDPNNNPSELKTMLFYKPTDKIEADYLFDIQTLKLNIQLYSPLYQLLQECAFDNNNKKIYIGLINKQSPDFWNSINWLYNVKHSALIISEHAAQNNLEYLSFKKNTQTNNVFPQNSPHLGSKKVSLFSGFFIPSGFPTRQVSADYLCDIGTLRKYIYSYSPLYTILSLCVFDLKNEIAYIQVNTEQPWSFWKEIEWLGNVKPHKEEIGMLEDGFEYWNLKELSASTKLLEEGIKVLESRLRSINSKRMMTLTDINTRDNETENLETNKKIFKFAKCLSNWETFGVESDFIKKE